MVNIAFSIGLGVILTTVIFILIKFVKEIRFNFMPKIQYKLTIIKKNMRRRFELERKKVKKLNKTESIIVIATGLLLSGVANTAIEIFRYFFMGVIIGYIIILLADYIKKQTNKAKKTNEIVVLFEAIELYTKAGYSLYQALKTASILTDKIRPAVDRCISYWGASPKKALEKLQQEIGLQESETLILILSHMEVAGTKNFEGIIQKEAGNVHRLQKMKSEIKIANRPLLLMIYRMLPLFSIIGVTVGGLLYRAISVMQQSGIINF